MHGSSWEGWGVGKGRLRVLITNLRERVKVKRFPWKQTLSSCSLEVANAKDQIQPLIIRGVKLQKY